MSKCSCWHRPSSDRIGWFEYDGVCYGTKERELCKCHGDQSKCDFYPPKGNGQMDTLDMMKQAKIDGKTYQGEHGVLYNVVSGFTVQTGRELRMIDVPADYVNEFFVWTWEPVQTITGAEAEKKLGVKIVG